MWGEGYKALEGRLPLDACDTVLVGDRQFKGEIVFVFFVFLIIKEVLEGE